LNFSLVYDEKKLNAWVHSEPLQALDQGRAVHLIVGKGVKSTAAGNAVEEAKSNWVKVPTLYSLALSDAVPRSWIPMAAKGSVRWWSASAMR
jgi:uncharacterized protein YfaS (alpha-2-macroglobulin family)